MAKYKKQHYIPKCYLKAWCDPNTPKKYTPYIWSFEKNLKEGKNKAPDNIFHETDLYTIWDEDGNRDLAIEHGFSGLEKQFSSIRRKKLSLKKSLIRDEHFLVCMFMATMHLRTVSQIENLGNMFKPVLENMENMMEHMKTATEEEKENLARYSSHSLSTESERMSYDDVKSMVEKPMETMMIPMIETETFSLTKLNFAILCTTEEQGFITSDNPCIWIDPEAYKRPPLYQAPALMYDSIEIIFPISPNQCIFLNRKGISGYINFDLKNVNNTNRIIRAYANKNYVSNQNKVDDSWFRIDKEPDDSWDNQHIKKANKNEETNKLPNGNLPDIFSRCI